MISSSRFRISPFVVYTAATVRSNDDHQSAGVDAIIHNFPTANGQFLARFEQVLLLTLANDPGHQAQSALRCILEYTTSMVYPHVSYIDFYTRFGDKFFPDEDTAISPNPAVQTSRTCVHSESISTWTHRCRTGIWVVVCVSTLVASTDSRLLAVDWRTIEFTDSWGWFSDWGSSGPAE